ncbi:MAG: xanthine dehydrogenase family protein molybdopterin-binding subunit [Actinomycetota bacterium]|nr:xanthine dehydrogenase family protein molybdopterin-binding subunit [Actinomycetota bacterium]
MLVGSAVPRTEDPPLIRGRGSFVADRATGAWAVRFVRSPVASGVIRSIEFPDGALVFTAADLEGLGDIRPMLHRGDYAPVAQPLLARDRVRFAGEPLAAVVARTAYEAEDLAEQVYVDIDVEDCVVDVVSAMADGAPKVHETDLGTNIAVDARVATPGVAEAFTSAAHVVEVQVGSDRQSAFPLETRGGLAEFDPRTGRVRLTTSTQAAHVVRTAICDVLGIPERDLQVIAPDVGGGFGQKYCLAREDAVVTWLARRLERRVAWIEDRLENFTSAFHSREHQYTLRAAFSADGIMQALDADIICNVGAYSCYPVTCAVEPLMAMAEMPGPYAVREYAARARAVLTNLCPIAPYRGVSRPVITLALERLMDTAARQLGVDPVELRLRNLIDDFPHTSPTGLVYDEASYREALRSAVEAVDLPSLRQRQAELRERGRFIGVGFSTFSERTGYGTSAFAARMMDVTLGYEDVELAMDPSGNVELRIGASPHGQGLATALGQIVADRLGIELAAVRVNHGDTDRDPFGWGSFASRGMVIAGGAASLAADMLAEQVSRVAAEMLEAVPEDIVLADGAATVAGTTVSVLISEVARTASHRRDLAGGVQGLAVRTTYDPAGTFSNACHVAVVEVDPDTGAVTIERFVVVEDAGLLVNPMIVDGQIHGGVCQGIANALYESLQYDDDGNLVTASLLDYLPPTIAELPHVEIHHLVTISDATLTGAKGVGEGGTIGAPAAVLNAISDALSPWGVDVNQMPATPSRIRSLIRGRHPERNNTR